MKKIVIIGKDSYIGQHIKDRFLSEQNLSQVKEIDARDGNWKDEDYSTVDTVIHVAGIVHRPEVTDWDLYKKVNIELPIAVAQAAKDAGVKQFVFFSTMGVYGVDKRLTPNIIDESTAPNPISMYGKSKYEAELKLKKLADENFVVTIVRPPNVYGKNCRGGYITGFASIIRKIPAIPCAYQYVRQSVIYIDNLAECIYQLVNNRMSGVFMPQDDKAVSAVELMQAIADGLGLHRPQSKILGVFAYLLSWTPLAKKAYGGIEYSKSLSDIFGIEYRVVNFEEGIKRTLS